MPKQPDLSEFQALAQRQVRRPPCQVASAAAALDDTQRAQLLAAIAASFTGGVIERWAKARDQRVTHQAVHAHRAGKCACADD